MSTLMTEFVDRWENRADPGPGQGVIYWHMLMKGHPEVIAIARETQLRLARFNGLHMTPLEWLHMTALVVGPADNVSEEQLSEMMLLASRYLAKIPAAGVTLEEVRSYPEAIVLGVEPGRALDPVLQALRSATCAAIGREGTTPTAEGRTPHITLCYSTSQQPAKPIIRALGHQAPNRGIDISTVSLVIQRGPERQWDWQAVGTFRLGSAL
jgi:2'-5' RNA ligase